MVLLRDSPKEIDHQRTIYTQHQLDLLQNELNKNQYIVNLTYFVCVFVHWGVFVIIGWVVLFVDFPADFGLNLLLFLLMIDIIVFCDKENNHNLRGNNNNV